MSKEYLEAFGRITLHTEYDNDGSYDSLNFEDDCKLVDEALERLEQIDNADPNEALKDLERIGTDYFLGSKDCTVKKIYEKEYNTIKNYILKAQEQEKEKLIFKHIHNTKVKTPLISIFKDLNQEERHKFIEHIYYNWEEMKEALEDEIQALKDENAKLKKPATAWDIVVKKNVDIKQFKHYTKIYSDDIALKTYNGFHDKNEELTEEEFDTLKGVIK